MDIAELGISIASNGVVVATDRLEDFEKQSGRAEKASEKLMRRAERLEKSMGKLGRSMRNWVTLPILAAGAAVTKFASDFESSFADVRKTVDATEQQFAQMSAEIRQLALEVPTPVEELNRLAGVAGQLGVQRENIVAFTRTIAMLGDASDIAGEQAALSLSRFMNVMGTAQGDIDRVGATIVGLGNNFAAMESEIVDTATSMAAFGNQMGLTEAQVLAFATAIAASGGQTEAASTAFQKTASTMQRAAIEMNEDLQVFARTAGVSAEQFASAFQEDASGAILMFLEGLKNISDQGQSTAAVLDKLGLADQRLQREFGKLLGNLGQLEDAIGLAGDEWERNTALTEEARKRYETFASQLGIFWNRIKDVGITLGNDLIPVIKSAIESSESFLETMRGLSPETRRLILVIAALVAAIGPLLIVFSALIKAARTIISLGPAVGTAFRAMLGPIGVATGVLWAVYEVLQADEERLNAISRVSPETADAFNAAMESIKSGAEDAGQKASDALDKLRREAEETRDELDELAREREQVPDHLQGLTGGRNLFGEFVVDQELEERLDRIAEKTRTVRAAMAVREGEDIFSQMEDGIADAARALGLIPEAANKAGKAGKDAGDEVSEAWEEATAEGKKLTDQLTQELAQWGMNEAEALRYDAALAEVNDTYGDATDEVVKLLRAKADLVEADREASDQQRDLNQLLDDAGVPQEVLDSWEKFVDFMSRASGMGGASFSGGQRDTSSAASLEAEIEALEGGAEAWREYRKEQFVANEVRQAHRDATREEIEQIEELAGKLFDLQEAARIEFELEGLQDSFDPLVNSMRRLGDEIQLIDTALNEGVIGGAEAGFMKVGATANAAFNAIMSGMDRSSKEYEQMAAAQQIVNQALGIAAILQQGMGDPYTAIPRMIAMAAMVSQLVDGIGSLAGGGTGVSAQQRQETQGTGSVLGMPEQQSESISNALEITADATSELVGINRGMLHALNNLSEALTGATTALARGFGAIDFGELNPNGILDGLNIGDPFGGAGDIFGIFSGEANVVDEGIRIAGGTIQELINNTLVEAFRDVEERSWILDDFDMSSQFEELGEEAGRQFQLIFQSIADTVIEGAVALGFARDEVVDRVMQFQVEAQRISLMDLDAEEQQEQIEAVFSRIFDDLAGHVVPFIDQFQQVGEGLGETLVRVATSVQVMQEAMGRLGFSADQVDPQQFAEISVGLIELAGGINEFIKQMDSFMDAFAPDFHTTQVAATDLATAFDDLGLELPETRQGVWELMQAQDASTEAGRENIAAILGLTDALDEFFSGVEALRQEIERIKEELRALELEGRQFRMDIAGRLADLGGPEDLDRLVDVAEGNRGAARQDVLNADDTEEALENLDLFVGSVDAWLDAARRRVTELRDLELDRINNQIQALEAEANAIIESGQERAQAQAEHSRHVASAMENARQAELDAINEQLELAREWQSVLDSTRQMIDDLTFSQTNPANRFSRLDQLNQRIAAQDASTPEGARELQDLLQRRLDLGRELFQRGSSGFEALFNDTMRRLSEIEGKAQSEAEIANQLQDQANALQQQTNSNISAGTRQSIILSAEEQRRLDAIREEQAALEEEAQQVREDAEAALQRIDRQAYRYYQWAMDQREVLEDQRQAELVGELTETQRILTDILNAIPQPSDFGDFPLPGSGGNPAPQPSGPPDEGPGEPGPNPSIPQSGEKTVHINVNVKGGSKRDINRIVTHINRELKTA